MSGARSGDLASEAKTGSNRDRGKRPAPFHMTRTPGVPLPAARQLTEDDVFGASDKPDCDMLLEHFRAEGRIHVDAAIRILQLGTTAMEYEPALLRLHGKITVVGDIHGQFYDLIELLKIGGHPSKTRYLFLGDYVDRGYFSVECVLYLWALKVYYPKQVLLLRGNHECRHLTQYFTYHSECMYKYNETLYNVCMTAFDCLPLAAVVDDRYLMLHGGLSPHIQTLDDIASIDRFHEPLPEGPMCDILWSDPSVDFGAAAPSNDAEVFFSQNDARGCSYYFSYLATCRFLERNGLLCLVRAHEVQDAGFRIYDRNVDTGFPTMLCIFSAPNYLDVYGNKGSILILDDAKMNIKQFNSTPHPYWLPNFMDCFTWSIPFIGEKVTEILHGLVQSSADDEEHGEVMAKWQPQELISRGKATDRGGLVDPKMSAVRRDAIKTKIRAIGRISASFRTLREHQEQVVMLKNLVPNARMPVGTLLGGIRSIETAIGSFDNAKMVDAINEKLPNAAPSSSTSMTRSPATDPEMANRRANQKLDLAIARADKAEKRGGGGGRR